MDVERIERALRDGPVDEPAYVPGSFHRPRPPRWWLVGAAVTVAIALVAGIAIGTGLDALRRGGVGNGEPELPVLTMADLQGTWESDGVTFEAWTDGLGARGFTQDEIDAFLEHDPFEDRVRYALRFDDDTFVVQAAYDAQPFQTLGGGSFSVDDLGLLRLIEVVDGVEVGCEISAAAAIDGARLVPRVLDLPGCDVDEQMANTIFFDIASYVRAQD